MTRIGRRRLQTLVRRRGSRYSITLMKLAFELPQAQAEKLRDEAASWTRARGWHAPHWPTGSAHLKQNRAQRPPAFAKEPGASTSASPDALFVARRNVDLHQALLDQTGGATGIRDLPASNLPWHNPATFDSVDYTPPPFRKPRPWATPDVEPPVHRR